ncbi:MAG: PEGA domain-containing protein [Myxococcales bacterium]|nr:PEGA domain-containing protein [Myxococcales bacterium]
MRHIVLALLWVLLGAVATPAWAAPDAKARAVRVQRFVDIATKQFKEGDFESALIALRDAEPLAEGLPALGVIRYNIARVFEEMGKADAAIQAYQDYLQTPDSGPRRAKAREALKRLDGQRSGSLEIDCGGVKGTVIVEGFPEGDCPWTWSGVKPGTYPVRVLAEGHLPARREVAVQPGQTTRVMLTLRPRVAAPKQAQGPGAWPWVAAGVGFAAIGTGVAFHLQALETKDDVEALPPGADRDSKQDSFEGQRLVAYVGYGVGLAGLGVATWLLLREEDGGATARVVPTGNGVLVRF